MVLAIAGSTAGAMVVSTGVGGVVGGSGFTGFDFLQAKQDINKNNDNRLYLNFNVITDMYNKQF